MKTAEKQLASSGKKLVIKPLRSRPKLAENFRDVNWEKLSEAVHAIQDEKTVSVSLEQLYRSVEDVCMQSHADWLYNRLEEECDVHAAKTLELISSWLSLEAMPFLEHVKGTWERYCSQLILIRQVFMYLDRTYLLTKSEHRSTFDMGLSYFRGHLLDKRYKPVEEKTVLGILSIIDAEREGESIDRHLLKNLVRMFALLGLYDASFMRLFFDRVEGFYSRESKQVIMEVPLEEYLKYVEKRIAEEGNRCDACLDPITCGPLIHKVESCIITPHVAYMLDNGFEDLLDGDKYEDLKRMYGIYGRVSAHKALCAAFKNYLKIVGGEIVGDVNKDDEMISCVISLKERMNKAVVECFDSNIMFMDALRDAFSHFINQRSNRPAELLAKYIDSILKSGGKASGSSAKGQGAEEEVESALDSCLAVFRFIQGKDAFEAFYKKYLAKRLLFNRTSSIDSEKSAISKLKAECGPHFTSKLEGMFKDIELSKDIMTSFKNSASSMSSLDATCPGTDLSVQVLTSGLWPTYPLLDCTFPENLANGLEIFKTHYLEKHSGRKLVWLHSLGTCIMKVAFDCGTKELAVSFLQAAVLMTFEHSDKLSFKQLSDATGLEADELKRTLQSLACGRDRILIKEPKGKDVDDNDNFEFNSKYTSRMYRVRINTIQMKESADESRKTNEAVMQDRQHQIDAAIVRIMKTRKTLGHKLLINELVSQLRFPVIGTDIKRRIESLIEREYLERDESDPQVYNYLA